MTAKTKCILKHLGIMFLCIILAVVAFFIAKRLYPVFGADISRDSSGSLQMLGYFIYLICFLLGLGAYFHLRMSISNARVHCAKCGCKAGLKDYKVLKMHMAEDNKHILSEDVQMNMCCCSCGHEYSLKKRFRVYTYSAKRHVWKRYDVNKSIWDYAEGKLWF